MQIEIRLQKLLADHKLDVHGVIQQIADDLDIHRHTVRKLYNNRNLNPSLKVLGQLCDWLQEHEVPAEVLPGALFGAGAGDLWQAAALASKVTIYLGAYRQPLAQPHGPWVSRRDASVVAAIVQWLSTSRLTGHSQTEFATEYLPFRVDVNAERVNIKELREDNSAALRMYRKIRKELNRSSAILVGSQRINKLVEAFVGDLFGCAPFVSASQIRVPFYLAYQNELRVVESCFGGLKNPPGVKGKFVKGIYYRDSDGQWISIPWIDGKQDSGIVITSYEPGTMGMLLAVFGLSGRGSEALGRYLTKNETRFWSSHVEHQGRQIGVYVCKIIYPPKASGAQDEPGHAKDVEVIPIDAGILKRYLNRRRQRQNAG